MVVAVIGVVLTAATSFWLWDRARQDAEVALAAHSDVLAERVSGAIAGVAERLVAVGGLYQASEEVTRSEFRQFVGTFDLMPGMGAVGYQPIIAAEDLNKFVQEVRETIPDYEVFELDDAGNRVPVGARDEYVPVQWFEPDDAFGRPHGFDSGSEPKRRAALERARSSGEVTVTPFLRLVSEEDSDGFVVYWPVTDSVSGAVVGFTLAAMDLSELLESQIPQSLSDDLEWSITDLAEGPPADPTSATREWTQVVDVGGRRWMLSVASSDNSSLRGDLAELLVIVVVGLAASVLAATGIYLYRGRSQARQELDRLRELARAKDQFLASVSHELRTPLTGVLGFAELLRDDDELSDEERRAMVANVADQATDLSYIIDDLLVAARSELDLLAVTRVPVSSRAQVAQILEAAGSETCQRVEIIGDADEAYKTVGDPARVRQILRNLISNACRYGGDHIQVRFKTSEQQVHIQLADNGTGIPPAEWEQIFEPYYRAHHTDSQPAALGIGLSVARHLARLMGGDLTYRRKDDWSVFELTLTAAEGHADSSVTEPSVTEKISATAHT
ncbi:MAG: CHASE domain-containing protein [Acidimicrobiia bacterium]